MRGNSLSGIPATPLLGWNDGRLELSVAVFPHLHCSLQGGSLLIAGEAEALRDPKMGEGKGRGGERESQKVLLL